MESKGKLYVVATPIGNLKDITYRAVDILNSVSFILAEDTRESAKLLRRYNISTPLVSYRDQNHFKMIGKILEKLELGLNLALVSDSGTPLISDPGFKLVRELREKGYIVEAIPGPSALVSALSISGLPTDKFSFLGFLPKSNKRREDILRKYLELESTVVLYESPSRILALLELLNVISKDCKVVLAKDLTKKREELLQGTPNSLLSVLRKRGYDKKAYGEFVVIISCQKG
ncbi:MAG: 16S rRNA (cytidine(1402)-2'-O)-methyltransferase [Candidatus Dojkabacteria bacterium]|jgi:16S rRNA (cytidine1402-2'-O)-methyltransferase